MRAWTDSGPDAKGGTSALLMGAAPCATSRIGAWPHTSTVARVKVAALLIADSRLEEWGSNDARFVAQQ